MAANKKYTINQELRTVNFVFGTLDENEKKEVAELQGYGYTIVAEEPKKRKAPKGISYEEMKAAAKGQPYEKELLEKIEAHENYMKVKKWFLTESAKSAKKSK